MSQIQPLHWQKDPGVAKADAGWAAEPFSRPGKGPPHPGTGSHLSLHCPGRAGLFTQPVLIATPEDNYLAFCRINELYRRWEHQSWSKVNSKIVGLGARIEWGRSKAFFLWEGVNTANISLHVS